MSIGRSSTAVLRRRRTEAKRVRQVVLPGGAAELPSYFQWKRAIDRVLAAMLLIPALPLIGLLTLVVRMTSRGSGLYRQRRVGRDGRVFTLYKIRTMRRDAEAQTGAVWTQVRDPRVTTLGRVLRKLHLDELPQLFNVLKGEMSLVGPRPERPEFVRILAEAVSGYSRRLSAPPGITGLAQLNLPPDSDLNSVRRKLVLDLEYIEHADLSLDLRLLLGTLARVVKLPEPLVLRLLGLQRTVSLPRVDAPSGNGSGGAGGAAGTPAAVAAESCRKAARGNRHSERDGATRIDCLLREATHAKPR